jgi:Lactonase, 7-bladed beta-propeller
MDSQGPLRIHGKHLLAVNPGSDSIAVFEIAPSGVLKPVAGSSFPSGGSHPMSLAVHGDIVYVANQAVPFANPRGAPNVTGSCPAVGAMVVGIGKQLPEAARS